MDAGLQDLIATVQRNCDISDAQFAGEYTMCTYLLKMREFYRWSQRIPYGAKMDSARIGAWVQEREAAWESVSSLEYSPLSWNGLRIDAFDSDSTNDLLVPRGFVYSAGYGRFAKPVFFIGELIRTEALQGYTVFVAGREHARELVAPPAVALGDKIFIRRDSLRRMLWEKIEEWGWRKRENAMARAIGYYGFDADLQKALDDMTENEMETVILHEIGEVVAGELIGDEWSEMLLNVSRTTAEVAARAVRDLIADCLSALPAMLNGENRASIHFYFANMGPLQRKIFPSLHGAYQRWIEQDDDRPLKRTVRDGGRHWLSVAGHILDTYGRYGEQSAPRIEALVSNSRF